MPAPVDIEIRRCFAIQIQEALKIQIELQRADVCNAKTVGNDTIGTTSATDVHKPHPVAVLDDVPSDQKIGTEVQLINYIQFLIHSGFCLSVIIMISLGEPFIGKFFQ